VTHIADFFGTSKQRLLPAGQTLFNEGDSADGCMYVLLEGSVALLRQGRLLERVDREGVVFGELALIDSLPRSATAQAEEDSRVAVIGRERFRELTLRNPSFALEMMALLARRLRASQPA
jgi:CRP-like cAMP-binding protein